MYEFKRLWQELDETADDEMEQPETEQVIPVNESIKFLFVEIPVSALRG